MSGKCQGAMNSVQMALLMAPVWFMPDYPKPFELVEDVRRCLWFLVLALPDHDRGPKLPHLCRKLTSAEQISAVGNQDLLAESAPLESLRIWCCCQTYHLSLIICH